MDQLRGVLCLVPSPEASRRQQYGTGLGSPCSIASMTVRMPLLLELGDRRPWRNMVLAEALGRGVERLVYYRDLPQLPYDLEED